MNVCMRMVRYACTHSARAAKLHVMLGASSSENTVYREHILSLSESRRASCGTRSRMAASLPLQTAKVGAGESMRGGGEREREIPALSAHHQSHTFSMYTSCTVCVCACATLKEREMERERESARARASESESERERERE
jgi:hypothetical protein